MYKSFVVVDSIELRPQTEQGKQLNATLLILNWVRTKNQFLEFRLGSRLGLSLELGLDWRGWGAESRE